MITYDKPSAVQHSRLRYRVTQTCLCLDSKHTLLEHILLQVSKESKMYKNSLSNAGLQNIMSRERHMLPRRDHSHHEKVCLLREAHGLQCSLYVR